LRFAGFADRGIDVVSGRSVQAVFGIGALIHVTTKSGQTSGAPGGFVRHFPLCGALKVASCFCFTR
jgi:hypothetical protein